MRMIITDAGKKNNTIHSTKTKSHSAKANRRDSDQNSNNNHGIKPHQSTTAGMES